MLDSIKSRKASQLPNHPPLWEKPKSYVRFGFAAVMLVLLAIGIFVGSKLVIFAGRILEGEGVTFSFKQLFIAADKKLIGEEEGEIRILLMGIGGQNHGGGTLTDTMILATLKLDSEKNKVTDLGLVSIPRDLVVYIPGGYEYRKINSAYAYGEIGDQKQGPTLAVRTVEGVLGMSVPYYAVIDFQGFKKIIDDLDGVEITIHEGFTDYQYPDERLGYLPPVIFEVGLQKMDGVRALQYVRSRHGSNSQGSDFARTRRQQQLLKALKDKATSFKVLTNLNLLDRLLDDLSDHIRTSLAPHELKRLYTLTKNIPSGNISSFAIDNQGGLLCDQIAPDTGAYILLPCAGLGNYEAIRETVKNQFLITELQTEQATIEIQNAAKTVGLAENTQKFLLLPYLQLTIGNFRAQASYEENIIYDNTKGSKPRTLDYLRQKLGIKVAQSPFPFSTAAPSPDFVIIVTK